MHYCYILYSSILNKYYVGSTSNLEERLCRHHTNHRGFTGRGTDWVLKYSEGFTNKTNAYARERQIKKWKSKKKIEEFLINKKPFKN